MAPGKGLYYFDGHFDRERAWYLAHFREVEDQLRISEVSHSYLYSREACQRIWELQPEMHVVACVREPAERAYSAYLHGVKNGHTLAILRPTASGKTA
jgi:hypothetical protein